MQHSTTTSNPASSPPQPGHAMPCHAAPPFPSIRREPAPRLLLAPGGLRPCWVVACGSGLGNMEISLPSAAKKTIAVCVFLDVLLLLLLLAASPKPAAPAKTGQQPPRCNSHGQQMRAASGIVCIAWLLSVLANHQPNPTSSAAVRYFLIPLSQKEPCRVSLLIRRAIDWNCKLVTGPPSMMHFRPSPNGKAKSFSMERPSPPRKGGVTY